jgi:membrane-associated phospholipid phosphatase
MLKKIITHKNYFIVPILVLVTALANAYALRYLEFFGSPVLFFFGVLFELLLVFWLAWTLVKLATIPGGVIFRTLHRLWDRFESPSTLRSFKHPKNRIIVWLKNRFDQHNPRGLILTFASVVASFFAFNFVGVILSALYAKSITELDTRALNFIPLTRTSFQSDFFRITTTLVDWKTLILFVFLTGFYLYKNKQAIVAKIVFTTIFLGEILTVALKFLIGRDRPAVYLRLIDQSAPSFPSGHALRATLVFGFIGYFLYKYYSRAVTRAVCVWLSAITILTISLSRVYLGVHYPSDVWAGFLLGASLLSLALGYVEITQRFGSQNKKHSPLTVFQTVIISAVIVIFAIISAPQQQFRDRSKLIEPATTIENIEQAIATFGVVYSETVAGNKMEPINAVYVGDQTSIVELFVSNGWYQADSSTLYSTAKAMSYGLQDREYLSAPVTPAFLNFKPETLAFQRSTETRSLRQRHHTRLWRSDYILPNNKQIWFATSSFDEGIELAGKFRLPTHYISPDIDAERDYITKTLGYDEKFVKIIDPLIGKIASGNNYFTDGFAQVIEL